jgi:hypothetical protein
MQQFISSAAGKEPIHMQFNPFDAFVNYIADLLRPLGLENFAIYVAIVPFFVLLYLLYLVVVRTAKISFRKIGMSREASSGIVFGLRLAFFVVAVLAVISVTNPLAGGTVLAVSTLVGTALGLAFSRAFGNVVSGLYVLGARPFRVGDYVTIGDQEGLVLEITLNYTRLLLRNHSRVYVPNSNVLTESVTNYRVRIDDYLTERGLTRDQEKQEHHRLDAAISKLKYLTTGEEIYRRTFDIGVYVNFDGVKARAKFDELCAEYADKFLEPPEYIFSYNQLYGIIYSFAYVVEDPRQILFEGLQFERAVAEAVMQF